jgi:hypothetical protein
MISPRWRLFDLLLLVFATALAFAAYRYFWNPPPDPNARPYLSAYLALLAPATLGAFFARPGWRRPSQGFALFGWCNLVFVMWGGFGLSTIDDAERIVQGSKMGMVFGILSAFLAAWFLDPPGRRQDPRRGDAGEES